MTDWSVICNHQRVIEAHKRQKERASGPFQCFIFFPFLFLIYSFKRRRVELKKKNLKWGTGRALENPTIIESLYIALDLTTRSPNRYSKIIR